MWRQTEPDNESSSKVTQEALHRMCAFLCVCNGVCSLPALCLCICVYLSPRGSQQAIHRAEWCYQSVLKKRLNCLKPTVQTKQRAAKKNHAAQADTTDVLRPTLLCYLVPHLLLSTTIVLYRQRAVVSVSLKQVGEIDKQVAWDLLHSQIIPKMVGEQSKWKSVQFGYVDIAAMSAVWTHCSLKALSFFGG